MDEAEARCHLHQSFGATIEFDCPENSPHSAGHGFVGHCAGPYVEQDTCIKTMLKSNLGKIRVLGHVSDRRPIAWAQHLDSRAQC